MQVIKYLSDKDRRMWVGWNDFVRHLCKLAVGLRKFTLKKRSIGKYLSEYYNNVSSSNCYCNFSHFTIEN